MPTTLTLDEDVVALLRQRAPAAALSETANAVLRQALVKPTRTFEDIACMSTQAVADSGMTEDEVEVLIDEAKRDVRSEKRLRRGA